MPIRLQVVTLILLLCAVFVLIHQVKKKQLDLRYSLSWIFLVAVMIILAAFPNILIGLTDMLGVATPSNMLFFFGFVISLSIIYTLTLAISKLADNVRSLTQKVALLEKELKEQDFLKEKDRDK